MTANTTATTASSPSVWEDEMGASSDQLFFVTSYSDFDKLAHGPRGNEASHALSVYRFHPADGSLVLLNVQGDPRVVMNPAFSRYHPRLNVVYTCTEDITHNGRIFAYRISEDGRLTQLGQPVDAGGTSTCYLTIDRAQRHMLAVNYWDSTLAVIPLDPHTGALTGPIQSMYDPKGGRAMVASAGRAQGGVNHSHNDASTIRMRQADPHSHALVLDPFVGCVAYVPDLGKDVIREFLYDRQRGEIALELNVLPSGLCTGAPDGPRYLEFHPKYNVAYVVNELSSTIAVFEVDRALLQEMAAASSSQKDADWTQFRGRSTLRLIQSVKTIPRAFDTSLNTCGRICVHKSGRFVVVSNRGHESIAILRVRQQHNKSHGSSTNHGRRQQHCGELVPVGYFHTRGETPRHFQFDASGQYLLVANQDTDSIAVFNFNLSSGEIKYTGNEYRVASPNFVCCCPVYGGEDDQPPLPEEAEEALAHVHAHAAPPLVTNMRLLDDTSSDDSDAAHARHRSNNNIALGRGSSSGDSSDNSCTYPIPETSNCGKAMASSTDASSTPSAEVLQQELFRAHQEIAELKKKLSSLTVE